MEPFWHANVLQSMEPFWHANVLKTIEPFWHANVLPSMEPFWHANVQYASKKRFQNRAVSFHKTLFTVPFVSRFQRQYRSVYSPVSFRFVPFRFVSFRSVSFRLCAFTMELERAGDLASGATPTFGKGFTRLLFVARRLPEHTNVAARRQALQRSGFSPKNKSAVGLRAILRRVYRTVPNETKRNETKRNGMRTIWHVVRQRCTLVSCALLLNETVLN